MKKLKELGISPAPWNKILYEFGDEEAQYQVAVADARFPVGAVTLSGNYCEADSCLIAAAPEMYEALRKITEEQECGRDCAKCTNHGCVIKECKAALAKASGEGEVAK